MQKAMSLSLFLVMAVSPGILAFHARGYASELSTNTSSHNNVGRDFVQVHFKDCTTVDQFSDGEDCSGDLSSRVCLANILSVYAPMVVPTKKYVPATMLIQK